MTKAKMAPAAGDYDYSNYEESTQEEQDIRMAQRLEQMANEMLDRESNVAKLEEELIEAKEALRDVKEKRLPNLMEDLGSDAFTTQTGIEIKIKEDIRGNIKKESQEEAFKWLEDNDHANLIKRQFVIDFGKDDEKWAAKFSRDLRQRKKPVNCKTNRTVHASTLQSFVREQLNDGVDFPQKLFGVFPQRVASIKVKTK